MYYVDQHMQWNTPGLRPTDGGALVYQPHAGERLVGALTRIRVTEAFDGTHPMLRLYAGNGMPNDDSVHWSSGRSLDALLGRDPIGDGALRVIDTDTRDGGWSFDVVWQTMTVPIRAMVTNSDSTADPGTTRGAFTIHLAFL